MIKNKINDWPSSQVTERSLSRFGMPDALLWLHCIKGSLGNICLNWHFGIPHNTPSLALKFCRSYCFQMQSGIWNNSFCFLAGNFFPTVCTLLGYFEVTWQVTMKLFPAKIFEWATLQNLWRQRVRCFVTRECLPTTAITVRFHEFPATSGFIQKIPTIFQRLFKDHIRFSRTTY